MKNRVIAGIISLLVIICIVVLAQTFMVKTVTESYSVDPINTEVGEVIAAADLDYSVMIWSINEDEIAERIESYFVDNSIDVVSIERVFPNTVIIHVTERVPICVVSYAPDSSQVALADYDFQLNMLVDATSIDTSDYILITGVEVTSTFNSAEFIAIRNVLESVVSAGTDSTNLPQIIASIHYTDSEITITYRDDSVQIVVL
ncbi:MAG: FtsQ-type POTRA domain-containing protein [Bacillota bacterium]